VVTQGNPSIGNINGKPPIVGPNGEKGGLQRLYSVDLLDGAVSTLTDVDPKLNPWHEMFPAFSHDGDFVVFVRTQSPGKLGAINDAQLYRVTYDGGLGGIAEPIEGASEPKVLQYYPSLTPDDAYVIYNRVAPGPELEDVECYNKGKGPGELGGTYNNCHAELWMIPSDGGTAIRLDKASGPSGSGFTNSWPSVGPQTPGKYHWVAFSSYRPYGFLLNSVASGPTAIGPGGTKPDVKPTGEPAWPQIWIAAIDPEKAAQGIDPSFSPIWLPGQDTMGGNHIAQWAAREDKEP